MSEGYKWILHASNDLCNNIFHIGNIKLKDLDEVIDTIRTLIVQKGVRVIHIEKHE